MRMNVNLKEVKRKGRTQTENIGVRLDKASKDKLQDICDREDVTVSSLVYKLIKEFVESYKEAS